MVLFIRDVSYFHQQRVVAEMKTTPSGTPMMSTLSTVVVLSTPILKIRRRVVNFFIDSKMLSERGLEFKVWNGLINRN